MNLHKQKNKEKRYNGLQVEYDALYESLSLEFAELERGMQLEGNVSEEEFIAQMTSYPQMLQEFQGAERAEVEDLDLLGEMSMASSFVVAIPEEESDSKFKYHMVIEMGTDDAKLLGTIAHEALHALESTKEVKNGKVEEKTGFHDQENDEKELLSEVIHTIILNFKIFKILEEKGYQIYDANDYGIKMLPGISVFYKKFEQAILDARCEPTLDTLYSIVGKENFLRLAQLQNDWQNATPEQVQAIIADMEEHSRQNLANRIGQFTLLQQKNVVAKDSAREGLYGEVEKSQLEVGVEYDE